MNKKIVISIAAVLLVTAVAVCGVIVFQNKKGDNSAVVEDPTSQPTPIPSEGKVVDPVFSRPSGAYDDPFTLYLTTDADSKIYYTTDGSIPLSKEENKSDFPSKLDTVTYEKPIEVKNRDGEENRLCAEENLEYMYDPGEPFDQVQSPQDGSVPKATVIRAVAVGKDGTKSNVITRVYFVGNHLKETYKNASVMSIVTDPDNLLSEETGIYRYGNWDNRGREWEREAAVTYIDEDGSVPFETGMGIRISGAYSRKWGQKSFKMAFRQDYGMKSLKGYQLIPGAKNYDQSADTTKYKKFVMRNGGNDYKYTKLQDRWIQEMVQGRAYTTQSCRPCVLFLNGEYWGLYNLTETYNDDYIENEFGMDKKNVIMVKNGKLEEGIETKKYNAKDVPQDGDMVLYKEYEDLAELDMVDDKDYAKFTALVDEQSCVDYYATQLFIGNKDWPDNNVELWRVRDKVDDKYGDGKWRYMLFDTEYSMNLYYQDEEVGNPIERCRQMDSLFDSLCGREEFAEKLCKAITELGENEFEVEKATKRLHELADLYRPLMEQYFNRFGGEDMNAFEQNIQRIDNFLTGRKDQMEQYMKESFEE